MVKYNRSGVRQQEKTGRKPGSPEHPGVVQASLMSLFGSIPMELKNRIWMNGSLQWFAYIGEKEVFLGRREVPVPLDEGDTWTNEFGNVFCIENGAIVIVEKST
jgi:hypothetical protein